jgi:hypothetical protein
MPEQLIATAGAWFFAACAAQFVAVIIEQAGAARSPEEDGDRKRAVMQTLVLVSFVTIGLLLLHGFFLTAADATARTLVMAAPIAAMLLGSLLGAILGALVRGAAPAMRKLALPVALVALAVTLYAALPTIVALAHALQSGALELPVHPV